ncbi:hypothetical protein GGR52DRAFT_572816 [Hypoxylon sp. FL1284]|nr:hypothetical protein GGR52DRAFT_572816 [Hypoxylon sp. FL1284]
MPKNTARTGVAEGKVRVQETAGEASSPFESYPIKNTAISEAPGVALSSRQKLLVGSVLDLFEGSPTLEHLSLWSRDATFADPLTIATGYDQFAAQWYGLPAVFSPIRIQSHRVTSVENPIRLDLTNKYSFKGLNQEQSIRSVVYIYIGQDERIQRVEDRWIGKLPDDTLSEGSFPMSTVPFRSLRHLIRVMAGWGWWTYCNVSWWRPAWALRKLNAVTVPRLITVPASKEEDVRLRAEREDASRTSQASTDS